MRSNPLKKAQQKYSKENQVRKGVSFTTRNDADILFFLDESDEAFGSLCKRLIRQEMERQGFHYDPDDGPYIKNSICGQILEPEPAVKEVEEKEYPFIYDIFWDVKYKQKVLDEEKQQVLGDILNEISEEKDFKILEYSPSENSVRLRIGCISFEMPFDYPEDLFADLIDSQIYDLVKSIKLTSTRRMFKAFPGLKSRLYSGSLWSPLINLEAVTEETEQPIQKTGRAGDSFPLSE